MPEPVFPNVLRRGHILFNDLRLEAIVRCVDIRGIVDHQCVNFLFII